MDNPTAWWILTGLFVALELLSGTFYLLMLALGAAAGALAAHSGLPPALHWVAFTLVGGAAVLALYVARRKLTRRSAQNLQHDDLDLGATVDVNHWSADGTTRVHYRGSEWSARQRRAAALHLGPHRIVGRDGIVLLIEPLPAAQPCPAADTDEPNDRG